MKYPTTPDGRYFVVRSRLWRCSNPTLSENVRAELVKDLMHARSAKGHAMRAADVIAREHARADVDRAKHALGERGDPWWTDGAPDWNRRLIKNSPYAAWYQALTETG